MTPRDRMVRMLRYGLGARWAEVAHDAGWLTDTELASFIVTLAEVRAIALAEQKGRQA